MWDAAALVGYRPPDLRLDYRPSDTMIEKSRREAELTESTEQAVQILMAAATGPGRGLLRSAILHIIATEGVWAQSMQNTLRFGRSRL